VRIDVVVFEALYFSGKLDDKRFLESAVEVVEFFFLFLFFAVLGVFAS
jgi:hypothetical protein